MASALAGLSTLGIKLGIGVETTSGTKPEAFTQLTRINSITGINIESETIDASALEDAIERTVAGRGSTGGSWSVTVNVTPATQAEWKKAISDYNTGMKSQLRTWFEIDIPNITEGFFVVAQLPQKLPLPELSQNELLTMEIKLAIEEYVGLDTKVAITDAAA